jgi:hypothetical protein
LGKAIEKITAGEKVNISYVKQESKYIAKRVDLITPKMITKMLFQLER